MKPILNTVAILPKTWVQVAAIVLACHGLPSCRPSVRPDQTSGKHAHHKIAETDSIRTPPLAPAVSPARASGPVIPRYEINHVAVSEQEFGKLQARLREVPDTYHCALRAGGGRISYEAVDSSGTVWICNILSDMENQFHGLTRKDSLQGGR